MIRLPTIRELFAYNDWARQRLLDASAALADDALDRPFQMGQGTLRKTLHHLYAAERVWLDRWLGVVTPPDRRVADRAPLAALAADQHALAAERDRFIAALRDDELSRPVTYTNLRGETNTFELGRLLLHVCNHGVHHRAQALNMLRRLGVALPKPEIDYIFMKLTQPGGGTRDAAPPPLDRDTLRAYFGYADWARDRTLAVAATLSDEQLDRRFEIGLGNLRKTLMHIRFAEEWWLQNWTRGPDEPFPESPDDLPIAELQVLSQQTAAGRNAVLERSTDADLQNWVEARPRPDVQKSFSLGVTMLQICTHGTHHRAQAANMLRHVGAEAPALDVLRMMEPPRC
ncbi:MAG: DinB family protein [Phycisphaerae bacterium]